MYKIGICDDFLEDSLRIVELLQKYEQVNPTFSYKLYEFDSMEKLLFALEDDVEFDLLFLDIYLGGMTGIEGAGILREQGFEGQIVFQSTSNDFIFAAFSVNAIQYLIKPVAEDEFFKTLDRVLVLFNNSEKCNVMLRVGTDLRKVQYNHIIYCETNGNYQYVYMESGETLIARATSTELFEQLSIGECFMQIGKSYIINMDFVDRFNSKDITMINGGVIRLPRGHSAKFKETYFAYLL